MTRPLDVQNTFWLVALFLKLTTPLGTAAVMVLVETTWLLFPAWLKLFGLPLNAPAIVFHRVLMLIFGVAASVALGVVLIGQQVRRFKLVRRTPCREVLYYPIRSATNTLWGFTIIPAVLVGAFFFPVPARLILHATVFVLLVTCHYELSEEKETAACDLARRFPKNSAERHAILWASHGWISILSGIMTAEVGGGLFWKLTDSKDIGLAAALGSVAVCVPFFCALYWSSSKMTRRIKIDLAYQEKKEREEADARKELQQR